MKLSESRFGEFEAFKVNNLKSLMGGIQHVETATEQGGEVVDSQTSTVYDNLDEADADGCDALSCHDAEFDCHNKIP